MTIILRIFLFYTLFLNMLATQGQTVKLAVAGIAHGHVPWILDRKTNDDVQLAGIYERDTTLWQPYIKRYHLDRKLFYSDLNTMLNKVKPQAVVAFGPISEHVTAVEACAPRGIHVMVEKPLATTKQQADRMKKLADENNIILLTNYETSWYPTTEKTYQLVNDSNFAGKITKAVFHHGHEGPKKIHVSDEFFNWLTDPVKNGGGALIDFGCYGANIMTYLMKGEKPLTVTAVTQHLQPDIYPNVDDEATIIVTYPKAQCIIQASWNWPFGRKDMEVYGETGYIIAADKNNMRMRNRQSDKEMPVSVSASDVKVYTDPFSYFADVINGKLKVPEFGLYSLENNVQVVHILDAARESARTGKTIKL